MVINQQQAAESFSPIFKGFWGGLLFKAVLAVTGIDKVNRTHQNVEDAGTEPGPDFAKGILDDAGIDMAIGNPERLGSMPEGPFIAIANHIYGHIDGIALVDVLGHVRPKTKVMVNEFLMWIRGLAPSFISVNPSTKTSGNATATSINGIKNALLQIKSGEPLALFPSGAVADWKPFKGKIEEREWQESAIKLIRKAKVPVVPILFPDHNSWFYYSLGLLDFRIRFVRLFHELFNKRGKHPRMIIGETIPADTIAAVPEEKLGEFLRSSVYDMPETQDFKLRSELWKK